MANVPDMQVRAENADDIAKSIVNMFTKFNQSRVPWVEERKELRSYLFATDTSKTTNGSLPWKNSTVTPKLTQIRDNLHANYMAALFPSEKWFQWESFDKTGATKEKRDAIEGYMRSKLKASGFELIVSQLVYDYIDYGNVIAGHEWVHTKKKDVESEEMKTVYAGSKAFRVSPLDCVFDPTATEFKHSPFIFRQVMTMGDLLKTMRDNPNLGYDADTVERAKWIRGNITELTDAAKDTAYMVDGFGTIESYLQSNMVELLHFYGDYYDPATGDLHEDQIITVIDRRWVLRNISNPSWNGTRPYYHAGWRLRPDNLWAQGPLDQLVGMQYRIDHLENLKADVFDQIAHPVILIKGNTVEEFAFEPGVQIFLGDEGEVSLLRPDATALNADMQIQDLMNKMEELAGAPKQAMGIRTPGEKTKYEVQSLENAAGRIFQSKVAWFEKNIIEPLLNGMLEESRRNMLAEEQIKIKDPDFGAELYVQIKKEDLLGAGKLFPVGARHFAEQARFVQELAQTIQAVMAIPTIATHISGKAIAKAIEENMGWTQYGIVKDNIMLSEQAETQRLLTQLQEDLAVEGQVNTELTPEDKAVLGEEELSKQAAATAQVFE